MRTNVDAPVAARRAAKYTPTANVGGAKRVRIPRGEEEKVDDDERTGDDEPPSRPSREESPAPARPRSGPGSPARSHAASGARTVTPVSLHNAAAPVAAAANHGFRSACARIARVVEREAARDVRSPDDARHRLGPHGVRGEERGGEPREGSARVGVAVGEERRGEAKEETVGEQDGEGVEDDVEGVEAERAGAGEGDGAPSRRPGAGSIVGGEGSRPPIAALRRKVSTVSGRQLLWLASLVKFWPQ